MNINVHIERLVLHGLPVAPHQGPLVQAAVEAELTRLLLGAGLAPAMQSTGGAVPSVSTPGIQLKSDSSPAQIGQQIARAVYGGIGK